MNELPLRGIKIIEASHWVAGPFCGMILANLGSEVVKVEEVGKGDIGRRQEYLGESVFAALNYNKKSLAVDLKTDKGREIFAKLVKHADVIVENFEPGVAERLGIDYEPIRSVKPDIIYCSIKGFGKGPYEEEKAFGLTAEALSGLMSITREEGGPPIRVGTSIMDMVAGIYAALAIVSALHRRERTKEGMSLRVNLFEAAVSLMGYWLTYYQIYRRLPEPMGSGRFPSLYPYECFQCSDGWIHLAITSEEAWRGFCDEFSLKDLYSDQRFKANSDRIKNRLPLRKVLAQLLQGLSINDVLRKLKQTGVVAVPVNTIDKVLEDKHLVSTGFFAEALMGDISLMIPKLPIEPWVFSDDERAVPSLGQHSSETLRELGYTDDEMSELLKQGVVWVNDAKR